MMYRAWKGGYLSHRARVTTITINSDLTAPIAKIDDTGRVYKVGDV